MTNDKLKAESEAATGCEASAVERLVMCGYCAGDSKSPAINVFKSSTATEVFCCEQHSNLALTFMKFLRKCNE